VTLLGRNCNGKSYTFSIVWNNRHGSTTETIPMKLSSSLHNLWGKKLHIYSYSLFFEFLPSVLLMSKVPPMYSVSNVGGV
jgi:hypothetical protein